MEEMAVNIGHCQLYTALITSVRYIQLLSQTDKIADPFLCLSLQFVPGKSKIFFLKITYLLSARETFVSCLIFIAPLTADNVITLAKNKQTNKHQQTNKNPNKKTLPTL